MKNLGKKIIGGILLLIISCSTNISLAVNEQQLNNEKQSNNQKITETEAEKEKVQEIKDETVKEVAKLDSQIDEYQSQINSLDDQIEEANTKIADANAKLEKAQKDYENQQKTLEERVVALYEAGETTYLDALLSSSESITDFISSYYVVSEIAESDLDLLNEIDKQKTEIENAKQELQNSKNELTSAKASKEQVSSQLQSTKSEKSKYVEQLSEQEKQLQTQIYEIKQANISIDQQIKAYQAELERERERKRKEEEEKKKQQSNSSSNNSGSNSGSSSNSGSNSNSGSTAKPSTSGFIYPVPSAYARVTTGWYYSDGRLHGASDFGSGGIEGQPVYAVADGIVVITAALTTSYGNYILIAHDNGLYTLYAHGQAGSIAVSKGQRVKQGQQIMRVGNTGNSFGAHLHFEVRTSPGLYENRKNPINYLP